ncbi:MAG: ankyrin repeat domain-containing protein [Leptospiraceae bacterium]|nr:ankyrin repeat domain-containing protein [Leptospiraceae bacterium]
MRLFYFFINCASPQERLEAAIQAGDLEDTKKAIADKADLEAELQKNITPLELAIKKNKLDIVKLLIEKGANVNPTKAESGYTPLHVAAINNRLEIAKYIIEKGSNINAQTKFGTTPLHHAAEKGSYEVAQLLIEKGADLNLSDKKGQSPLLWAIDKEKPKLAKLLITKGADIKGRTDIGWTPLYSACFGNDADLVKTLIDKGADVNAKSITLETPLHVSVHSFEITKLLLAKGANKKAENDKGELPIDKARKEGNPTVLRLLGASEDEIAKAISNKERKEEREKEAESNQEERETSNTRYIETCKRQCTSNLNTCRLAQSGDAAEKLKQEVKCVFEHSSCNDKCK